MRRKSMIKYLQKLEEAFAQFSVGTWKVEPTLRPDLDDDPMAEYVISSHQAKLTGQYRSSDPESEALDKVHQENAANAAFIMMAHNLMPEILGHLRRLESLQADPNVLHPALKQSLLALMVLYDRGTKGGWSVCPSRTCILDESDINLNEVVQVMNKGAAYATDEAEANLNFIAMMRNTFPHLVVEIERLQWLYDDRAQLLATRKNDKALLMPSIGCHGQLM
jgi:hypothetical protein